MAATRRWTKTPRERLEAKIEVNEGGCWLWTAAHTTKGYGVTFYKGRQCLAHRVMFELEMGRPPAGLVLHRCDTRNCINPGHLFEGSAADNTADMIAKGRAGWQRYPHIWHAMGLQRAPLMRAAKVQRASQPPTEA